MQFSKFHTVVDIPNYHWQSAYGRKNIFIGSCFTENVGNKMTALKYDVDINPFGILYNPVSVANGLQILLDEKEFVASDLIEYQGIWHSFSHHGRFSSHNKNETLQVINTRINDQQKISGKPIFYLLRLEPPGYFSISKQGK